MKCLLLKYRNSKPLSRRKLVMGSASDKTWKVDDTERVKELAQLFTM